MNNTLCAYEGIWRTLMFKEIDRVFFGAAIFFFLLFGVCFSVGKFKSNLHPTKTDAPLPSHKMEGFLYPRDLGWGKIVSKPRIVSGLSVYQFQVQYKEGDKVSVIATHFRFGSDPFTNWEVGDEVQVVVIQEEVGDNVYFAAEYRRAKKNK